MNAQYLSIRVTKTKEVIKVNKKAFSPVPKIFNLFLKMLTTGLMNLLSKCQDI